jgi:hypothetical protein
MSGIGSTRVVRFILANLSAKRRARNETDSRATGDKDNAI